MSTEAIARAFSPIFATNSLAISPEVLAELVRAATLKASSEAVRRFMAQYELLSGGPLEVGEAQYSRVMGMAFENIFEAIATVSDEHEFEIGLGPFVVEAPDPLEPNDKCYYHPGFGWVESMAYAYGYASLEEAQASANEAYERITDVRVVRAVLF